MTIKRLWIWLAGMLVISLLADIAGSALVKITGVDTLLPSMYGYSAKMDLPPQPAATEEERRGNAGHMAIRAILSDSRMVNKPTNFLQYILFQDMTVDESIVFTNADGFYDFSSGIFASVYRDTEENVYMMHTFGLIPLQELVQLEGADALIEALREHPDAELHLNAYTINENCKILPVSITLYNQLGTEIATVEFPADGDVIHAEDVRIDNRYDETYTFYGIYEQMKLAAQGERKSDRIARELAEHLSTDAESSDDSTRFGLMTITATHTESRNQNGLAVCYRFYFWKGVLLHTCILGAVWTIIYLIVCITRSKKNSN